MRKYLVSFAALVTTALLYSANDTPHLSVTPIPPPPPSQPEYREAAARIGVEEYLTTSAPTTSPSACFHNRVMFQPVFCSKVPDIVSKTLELTGGNRDRNWTVVHVGSRDGWLKLAELGDLFGSQAGGTIAVGRALKTANGPSQDICGSCCECASSGELKVFPRPFHATLLDAPFSEAARTPSDHGYWKSHTLVKLGTNDFSQCPGSLLDDMAAELSTSIVSSQIDVLSLDAWRCDVPLLERVVLRGPKLRPKLLDFTAAAGVSYKPLIDSLSANYHCYFMTTKPEHKRFRGIRQPQYPIAVKLDGCWRGVYDSFRSDRYHITCSLIEDGAISAVLSAFTRMAHKGLHAGCTLPSRSSRTLRLDAFLSEV